MKKVPAVVPAVLLVVAVALLAVIGVTGVRVWHNNQQSANQRSAVNAAERVLMDMYSIDYRHVDPQMQAIVAGMTGTVRNQWVSNSQALRSEVTTEQISATATLRSEGVVSASASRAEALIAIDSTSKSPQVPNGNTNYYRWDVSLTKTGQHWLVSELQTVP